MKSPFTEGRFRRSTLAVAAIALSATTLAGAGAATLHRFTATQTGGSEGSTAFVNPSGGALQGEVAASANTSIQLPFGVLGEYNASNFGIGVAGISTTGYAVAAESLGGSPAMLSIAAGGGNGIEAYEKAVGANNNALAGVYGESDGNSQFAVYGYDAGTSGTGAGTAQGVGIVGETKNGIALAGYNDLTSGGSFQAGLQDGRGVVAAGASGNTTAPALEALSEAHGGDVFQGRVVYDTNFDLANEFEIQGLSQNRSGTVNTTNAASDVQMNGDLYITGAIYSGCSTFPTTSSSTCSRTVSNSAVTRSSNGDMVQTYGSMHASPTLEDEGEAQVSQGYTHVNLDPTFARTMSLATPYMVFVTPEGDSALYVTHKTPTGFDVRTVGGARASLAFSYRIVAHPFETNATGARRMAVTHPAAIKMNNTFAKDFFRPNLTSLHASHRAPASLVSMKTAR